MKVQSFLNAGVEGVVVHFAISWGVTKGECSIVESSFVNVSGASGSASDDGDDDDVGWVGEVG